MKPVSFYTMQCEVPVLNIAWYSSHNEGNEKIKKE